MTSRSHTLVRTALLLFLVLTVSGCSLFYGKPVRHLASDAALITPGQAKNDVLAYLGEPDERRTNEQGEEVWIYMETQKSTMRKTPYVGKKLGTEEYDMVNVVFSGELVSSCAYRRFNEGELEKEEDDSEKGEKKE